MISLLYPKEEKRKLTELLFTLQKLWLNAKMYAGSEKCRHIRNSSRLFTGRKGNTHGKNLQTKFSTRQYMLSGILKSTIIMSRHLKRFPYIRMITMSFTFFLEGDVSIWIEGSSIL